MNPTDCLSGSEVGIEGVADDLALRLVIGVCSFSDAVLVGAGRAEGEDLGFGVADLG
jgi:hypothetical protein